MEFRDGGQKIQTTQQKYQKQTLEHKRI